MQTARHKEAARSYTVKCDIICRMLYTRAVESVAEISSNAGTVVTSRCVGTVSVCTAASVIHSTLIHVCNHRRTAIFGCFSELSAVRLWSVCNARAPYTTGWNFRQCFDAIWYLGHPLTSTEYFIRRSPWKRTRSLSHLLMSFLLIYVALLRFFEEQQPSCVESAFIIRSMTINFAKTCKHLGTRKLPVPKATQLNTSLFVVSYTRAVESIAEISSNAGTVVASRCVGTVSVWTAASVIHSTLIHVCNYRRTAIFGRPFVKRFTLCYRTIVCLSVCLSVTFVYCGQTVGRSRHKNSSGDEIANVKFYADRPEATRIRWNNTQ